MESNNALKARTLALAIAIGAGGPATAVRADELQDLKTQIEALQKKVGELETKQETAEKKQAAAVPDNVVTGGAAKGSFKLPGSNTSVTLGGYVKLDAVYSNPSAGVDTTADLFLQPNAIAVGPGAGDNERNQLKFGARESRLFAKTSTPTSWGDLVTYIEGDFYGADGNDLIEIGRQWQAVLPDAAFVAPHGPERCAGAPTGRQWFHLTMRDPAERWRGVNQARAELQSQDR